MAIKAVKIWDSGWRLALLKTGTKWAFYITLELPIRIKRVKLNKLSYVDCDKHTIDKLRALLLDKHAAHINSTKGALRLIKEAY